MYSIHVRMLSKRLFKLVRIPLNDSDFIVCIHIYIYIYINNQAVFLQSDHFPSIWTAKERSAGLRAGLPCRIYWERSNLRPLRIRVIFCCRK